MLLNVKLILGLQCTVFTVAFQYGEMFSAVLSKDTRNYELFLLLLTVVLVFRIASAMRCASHNVSTCGGNKVGCYSYVECDPPEQNKRAHCYVLWQNDSSGFKVLQKGTF